MQSRSARLDRFISARTGFSRRGVRLLLAQRRVTVNNRVATDINQVIEQFSHVALDNEVLQADVATYVMLNKPMGVVSATRDRRHRTVIDCLRRSDKAALHLVGRLDYNSTGLVLLTNNGAWSRQLADPVQKVTKIYRVKLANPLTEEYMDGFEKGMYFSYEGVHTQPAKLRITSKFTAEVSLTEGRYHQIKRMFGHFGNPVLALHRTSIGGLELDPGLAPGESRDLSPNEVTALGESR